MTNNNFCEPTIDDGFAAYPHIELNRRKKASKNTETPMVELPEELRNLANPTVHQKLAVTRYLAFILARTLYLTRDEGFAWYESWYEETQFDDYLEVAIGILAALNISIISTEANGSITARMAPATDDFKEQFLEFFLPVAHYLRYANPDGDEDFAYNFDDAPYSEDELGALSVLGFFNDRKAVVTLDPIFKMAEDNAPNEVVVKKLNGLSLLTTKDGPYSPAERILKAIIDVVYCFDSSYELEESENFASDNESIEELRQNKLDYIAEFPDEAELAEESFISQARGELEDFEFISEYSVFYSLGILEIQSDGFADIQVVLHPPLNVEKYLSDNGLLSGNKIDILKEYELDNYVSLGHYEYVYFTPDDDND